MTAPGPPADAGEPPAKPAAGPASDIAEPSTPADAEAGADVADAPEKPTAVPLREPADGVPEVVADERALRAAEAAIAAGSGPVAVDAERASGYRYGQRAYLVQLRRKGAGSFLIDPIACPDLSGINAAIGSAEWVLHAATQDLPCLAEVGMAPTTLFDTELGGRLVGLARVGLAAVVEHYLGLSLAKEHSAVDWSTRPLPEPWLRYAALDVEVLVEVRDAVEADLLEQGKQDWAAQEFAALVGFTPVPRTDPWRRTSGMHQVRSRRGLAVMRELWTARDTIGQQRDISPGRVLPDAVLVAVAVAAPRTAEDLNAVANNRALRRYQRQWLDAVRQGRNLPDADLPTSAVHSDAPPPARSWADREPIAAARLADARAALAQIAADRQLPLENLLSPDSLRRIIWAPPEPATQESVAQRMVDLGARPWQVDLLAETVATAVAAHAASGPGLAAEPRAEG